MITMKPLEFKEQTVTFAKDQPEYKPMPAFVSNDADGQVTMCWGLSLRERLRVLFTGKIWVSMLMFGKPLTPSLLSTQKSDHITINK